ncbi:GNAT family N-acetyltransferase [Cellulomonas sp. GbtcB1]|uniref:GNAT family N-acetyltransferase n=1 Tax=Cellulomonas sp. GbtcB1 TaxID=2824746 RepID=UPI001C2F7E1E|nr:GNAT family N-acetyltransferase [Cellulomonas sp. GbtcB1]
MPADVMLEDRLPTPHEHRRLAEAVGWAHAFDWPSQPASLAGSTLGVVAVAADGETVGMARVVGDGVKYFMVQDVVVLPGRQGQGIGRALLARVLDLIARRAPAPAFVTLFATAEGSALYRAAGFEVGDMTGMVRVVEPRP